MDLPTNADGLVELELLEAWPPDSEAAAGDLIAVDPQRAAVLIRAQVAAAPAVWTKKISPAEYIERFGGQEDPSDAVRETLELARQLVVGEEA